MRTASNPYSPRLLSDSRWHQTLISLSLCALIGGLWLQVPHPAVAAAAFLPLLLAFGLLMPFVLCLLFVAFSFFRLHEVFPQLYPLRIPQLLAVGTLGSLAFNLILGRLQGFWSSQLTLFAVFFSLVTFGITLATNRPEAIATWSGNYIKIAIMVVAIGWLTRTAKDFRLILLVMLVCGLMVSAVTLHNKANGLELVEGTRVTIGRSIGSMLGDPNDLSLVLLFPASFALATLMTPQLHWLLKILGVTVFSLVLAAIIATQSRGGLLGICAVMGIFSWYRVQNKALLIMLGIVALSILFVLAGVSSRASGGAHEEGIDESAMGRIYAWEAAFKMALYNPLTGVGLNNFISNYFAYSSHWDGMNHAVHSTWFGVMAETGFLGLLLFLAMVASIVRVALRARKYFSPANMGKHYQPVLFAMAQALQAGIAGFCISGTFLTMGFTWPLYILLALSIALNKALLNSRSTDSSSTNIHKH
ncbi:MAG: O-antigen ligase family protein [Marinobacterium sp.]|nr:O-antigen ligase family protein [Marinobacterium sp.]